eukprot:COSAG02_NODE_12455_length_1542_cov_1.557173_1_plen_344_part_00
MLEEGSYLTSTTTRRGRAPAAQLQRRGAERARLGAMSIYEEKTGAEVGSGGLRQSSPGGDGAGDEPAGRDGEMEIPDWGEDTGAPPPAGAEDAMPAQLCGPAHHIAEFKAKREKRERVALGTVFNVLLVLVALSFAGIFWLSHNHNPETNPFVKSKNGTITLTSTGTSVHLWLWSSKHTLVSVIVSVPLDLEALASEIRWADIAAGRVPQLVSVCSWAFFVMEPLLGLAGISAKYGLWSVMLPAVVALRLIIWKFEFAVQPGDKHWLLRHSTCLEQYTLSVCGFACIYPAFVLWCIKDRQWDGKTVGRFGGLMVMLLQLASVVVWWIKRAKVRRCAHTCAAGS